MRPSLMHSQGREKSILKFSVINPARNTPACVGESSPVVRGRALVLSTCMSMSLSVKSLMIQPALRQDKAPTVNRPSMYGFGIKVEELKAKPQ